MSDDHLNLDELERPDRVEPFKVTLGGRSYALLDLKDVDYRVVLEGLRARALGDSLPLIRSVVPEADQEEFFKNHLPGWRLEALFDSYNAHHGINPGEASASPAS